MPRNEQNIKWSCDYCTYLNWPTAVRCVMCRASKQGNSTPEIINERGQIDGELSRSSSDEIICPDDGAHHQPSKKKSVFDSKWVCVSCTYNNPVKNETCVMCFAKKPDTVNQRNLENSDGNFISESNLRNDSNIEKKSKSLLKCNKWTCSNCTFDNWPKSFKCALCQTSKNRLKNEECTGRGNNVKKSHSSSSIKHSPPRSPRSPIGACKKSSDSAITDVPRIEDEAVIELSNTLQASCKLRHDSEDIMQIRNKMSNKDWLWLGACKGIRDHNVTAVKKYLTAGGDRTRQLTKEDILVLGEPANFEIGHTLVHLAINFQREDILRILLRPEPSSRALKRLPSHLSPELASAIRKQVAYSLRQKKGTFQCLFSTEQVTFFLPGGKHFSCMIISSFQRCKFACPFMLSFENKKHPTSLI